MCSTSSALHLTSFHPLLVRQLHTSIRELETKPEKKRASSSTNFKLSTVFAILAKIDVPLSSTDDILRVLPCLRDYILSVPIEQVLNSSTYLDSSPSWGDWIVPKVETLKEIHRGTIKRRTRPRRNHKRHSKVAYDDSDDSDVAVLKELQTVQVHERVLMSDSDGFPAVMGDTPSAGSDTCRLSVDDGNLYVMYKYLFGCFPTLITQLDSLLFALNVYTKFAARDSIDSAISFLSEYIESNTTSDAVKEAAYTYPASGWKTWQLLSRQCSFCVAALAALAPSLIGINSEECMEKAIILVLSQFKWNITGSLGWNSYMNSDVFEEMCLALVDDTMKFNNVIGLQFLETSISLLNMSPNTDLLTMLGSRIVEWSQEDTFCSLIDIILQKVDLGFQICRQENVIQSRFVFDLFSALVNKSEITEVMLKWVCRQPCGFRTTVKGVEILAAVTPHIVSYPGLVAEVLRRHISVVHWSFASRSNSFTMRLLPGSGSIACTAVVELSQTIKKYKNRESLLQILSVVLRYCDPVDTDCLLIENVVPTILEICNTNRFEQVDENNPKIGTTMTVEMKVLLKLLELLAAYLQTPEAAAEVIKSVIMPYRAFLFTTTEVQDVFVAVCAKAIRLSSITSITCGLSKWVFERLYSCYEHAKRDIWVFMDNSASMFCKLLLAMLNIVSDVIEDCIDPFQEQVEPLLLTTNKLIDACFEWTRLPSDDDRSCHRLAQLMCKSMSIHLMLHKNTDDVLKRFSAALLKTLSTSNPPSRLISYVMCSLLDCCVSRFPPSFGSFGKIGSIEQHSEDDALMGEGCPVSSAPPLMVLHPNMVKCVLSITASILTKRDVVDEDLEFLINKICMRLQIIDSHCTHGTQWLEQMFCVCDALTRRSVSSPTVSHLLNLIVIFIKRNPTSEPIGRLLSYYHHYDNYKEVVLSAFNRLICESTAEPVVSLLFPQYAAPLGIDVSTDERKISKAQKDIEISRRSSSSSLLVSAVERFLSRPKTDVETESERRLEKKKHLRDTVRDSPNLALGPIGGTNMSSPIKFSGDSAASFILTSGAKLNEGISTAFWIRRRVQAKTVSKLHPLHLLSIGNDEIVVRCSVNGRGRVTVDVTSGDIKIDRLRIRGLVKESEWTHIVLAVQLNADSIFVQGTVGHNTNNLEAPLIVKLNSHSFYPTIAFGCSKRRSGHGYYLSNIFGYKGLVNESNISVLASLGCQLSSLTETRVQHISPNIISTLNYKSVTARRRSLEAVLNDTEKYIHKLQRSLFFQVRSNSPLMYSITCTRPQDEEYACVEAHPGISSRLQSYPVNWGDVHPFQHLAPSVHNSITALGGIRMIIYMYAKAVNDGLNAKIQYSALSILLHVIRTQSAFYCHDLDSSQINRMLTRTLASEKAIIDEDIIELLIEHCISYSEAEITNQEDVSVKTNDSHMAVIRDGELLVSLACRSELWRNLRFPYWRRLIATISSVLDPLLCSSTFKFNRTQLIRTEMLQKLMHCILQMIQDATGFQCLSFADTFVSQIIFIVDALLESPYNLDSIANLWNFIFLSHPAVHTYIDHRVEGHSSWINSDFVREDGESEIIGDSPLCKTFKKYLSVLGRDTILEMWRGGATPYEIRKAFTDRIHAGNQQPLTSDDSLPDLLRDVDALLQRASTVEDDESDSSSIDMPHHISERKRQQGTKDPEWVTAVRAGLMNSMATALQNGADSLLACLQHDVVSWHAIVVLLSHQSEQRIRDAAVDILQKFLLRSPTYTKITFLRLSGFQMLASQLRNQPVSPAIADHLFSMMCGEVIRLGDGLDQNHLATMTVDSFQCESLHAIFVAFEESVPDTALFWNITNALIKVFENCSQLRQAMVEEGLADVMINTLRRIATLDFVQEHDIFTGKPVVPLQLEAWSLLAQRMLILSIPYVEPRQTAACERFMQLLLVADIQAARDSNWSRDVREQAHKMIRGQLCQLLHTWMESIRIAFSEEGKSASATSSMDSLYRPDDESSTSSPSSDYDFVDDVITSEKAHLLDGTSPVAAFIAGSFSNLREKISHMGPIHRRSLRCPYPRRTTPSPMASFQTLTDRIIFALETDATVFAVLTPTVSVVEEEKMLYHFYLYYLLGCWRKDSAQNRSLAGCIWDRIMVQCRDRVRVLLAQAVAFILFPARRKMYEASFTTKTDIVTLCNWRSEWVDEKRRQLIRALAQELQNRNALKSLLSVNLDYEYALCLGLYELGFVAPLCSKREEDINAMIRFIGTCKVGWSMDRFTTADELSSATTDEMLSVHSFGQHKNGILSKLRSRVGVIRDEEEKTVAVVSDMTMAVTREAVEEQNIFRKLFIKNTKEGLSEFVTAEKELLAISRELCHPCSSAYEPQHWPVGWALDPTENPHRERRRLMPYYYPFESRFFMEDRRSAVNLNQEEAPLSKILVPPEWGTSMKVGRSLLECVQIDEAIRLVFDITVLRGTMECSGELLVTETQMHFVGERAQSTQKGTACSVIAFSWKFDEIVEIFSRNHLLKDVALEVFTIHGVTNLFVFQTLQKRNQFKSQLKELGFELLFPNAEQMVHQLVQTWRKGNMTNFEYLMQLNKYAGRSFNDLMQYPIFPFVLADYSSAVLDLNNQSSFRDLTKPMAIQDKRMEDHYVRYYNCLKAECERGGGDTGPMHFGPYHYGSHYSNSGIVAHYLVRLSPFTQIALEYQDNNFDIPDRLFNSIEATWRLSSSESTTDFKELIPEFFCLPEFLRNRDSLDLGVRQAGERANHVLLPNWVPNADARLFILIHRQALESTLVTHTLQKWVDLIFGFKQTGKPALDAVNVFHPATYAGHIKEDELWDEVSQNALRTMVKSYGQMPIQIFTTPTQPYIGAKEKSGEKLHPPGPGGSVVGVRWGEYLGSPEQDNELIQPVLSLKAKPSDKLKQVISFPDGSGAAVPKNTILISTRPIGKISIFKDNCTQPSVLGALSWMFNDSVLRFRSIKPEVGPWINIMSLTNRSIATVCFSENNQTLFIAFSTGIITAYRWTMNNQGLISCKRVSDLIAHHTAANTLFVCDEFSILVSADSSGKVIEWDINRLSYVREIRKHPSVVNCICVSAASGDIAVVSQQGLNKNVAELFSINGDLLGSLVTDHHVNCIAMTNLSEGTAINCLALGIQGGHVKLVEMWTMTVIRDIFYETVRDGVMSLTFSSNGRRLFVLHSTGRILCWQSVSTIPTKSSIKNAPPFSIINPHDMD